jgi:CBS domain containing-hemolysin-like protein
MAAIPDDLSVEEMIEAARKHRHRRLPIYDETPDTIVGILNTRALLMNPQIDLADASSSLVCAGNDESAATAHKSAAAARRPGHRPG